MDSEPTRDPKPLSLRVRLNLTHRESARMQLDADGLSRVEDTPALRAMRRKPSLVKASRSKSSISLQPFLLKTCAPPILPKQPDRAQPFL